MLRAEIAEVVAASGPRRYVAADGDISLDVKVHRFKRLQTTLFLGLISMPRGREAENIVFL